MTAIVRPASIDDAPELARIHRAAFDAPWDADSFRRLLEGPGAFALLAKAAAATDLQSFILIQVAADESEILSIATVPAARHSGLARALIVEAADEAARRGAHAMFLEVAEDNVAALALYRNLGFAEQGRRRDYYIRAGAKPVDALMLRMRLPVERVMGMTRSLD